MEIPNWSDWPYYYYVVIGGAAVIIVAIILYFTPISRMRMPAVIVGVFGGLAAGLGAGVLLMAFFGYRMEQTQGEGPAADAPKEVPAKGPGGPGRGGMMGRAGPGGGGNRGGGGGNRGGGGANSKVQLALLINKLDILTNKPLQVTLDSEQKRKLDEQIRKLDEKEDLSDEEAQKTLDGLLDVLKDQRETLEGAGFRWPGQAQGGGGGRGRGEPTANPFREGANHDHLKALRQRLEEKKAG